MRDRPTIYLPLGDPNGIGPEIAIKAACDRRVEVAARPVLVGDAGVLEFYADLLSLDITGIAVEAVEVHQCLPVPGQITAAAGKAAVAYAQAAIARARTTPNSAVVAGPHNETAVAEAGISFSGYPGLLAAETGTDPDKVFLMLISQRFRIVHVTLHLPLEQALGLITPRRVEDAIGAANNAVKRLGIAAPRIGVCGINPHAGEGGLFGDHDERLVGPAVRAARAAGIIVEDPAGADVLLADGGHDVYVAMYHDQGHIPVKLEGRGASSGVSIGTDVLFSTVAHGSAHDIAGQGIADPQALIGTVLRLANTP
jgi:4-hydroxy-L-threonine phosphate dehydrogenase PdxA